jgi:hypothetical protein
MVGAARSVRMRRDEKAPPAIADPQSDGSLHLASDRPRARLAPFMPFAIRLHLAVSLVGLLSMGDYLSPAMDLPANVGGIVLGIVMAIVAVSMAAGWHARWGAALLVAAGPLGMAQFGFTPVLQRVDLLGLAVFVAVAGAGRWSADAELGRVTDPTPLQAARASWALRVGAGLALIVVAFAEKLANPQLALHFLADHEQLNVAHRLGLHMSDLAFIRTAGAIEVLFGLLLISGAMLVLLVYGSQATLRDGVRAAWPWSTPQLRRPRASALATAK